MIDSLKWDAPRQRRLGIAVLVAAHLGLLVTSDLAAHPWLTLSFMVSGFAGLGLFLRGCRLGAGISRRSLMLIAIVLRLLLLPLVPTLSDDVLRYVWDGRVVASGANPYELTPEDPALAELRDSSWEVMPHKDVATVYPPVALSVFSIAGHLPFSLYALKAILACVDLVGCALLASIAARRGLPLARAAAFAWNPLVTLEVAGMGHLDALGVTAMIAAVFYLCAGGGSTSRTARAALWSGVGVLAKLVPLVAMPMWARQSGGAGRYLALSLLVVGLGAVPVLVATGGVPPGLVRYAVAWEFNGPLFEPLWRLLAAVGAPGGVALALDRLKEITGLHEALNGLYHYRYPQFLAKLVLWCGMLWAVGRSLGHRDPIAGSGRLLATVMLLSATVYPWYLMWVLPWAALCRQRAWLALALLVQLSYLPQAIGVELFPWIHMAIWVPFAVLLALTPRWSTEGSR